MRRTIAIAITALSAFAVVTARAQTPTGNGPPAWNMGYRIDLGLWHGLRLDTSDNLYVNCVAGCSGGGGGGGGGTVTQGTQGSSSSPWYVAQTGALPAGSNVIGGVTQSGAWTASLGAGAAAIGSVTVSNLPSNPALETGGNLAAIVTNTTGLATAANQSSANGNLSTIASNTANTAAGTSAANAQAMQGVTGGVPVQIAGTVSGNLINNAAANAGPPVYAAGNQPLSQTLGGGLRVQLNAGGADLTTLPVSIAALPSLAAGTAKIGAAAILPATGTPTACGATTSATAGVSTALLAGSLWTYHLMLQNNGTAAVLVSFIVAAGTALTGSTAYTLAPGQTFNNPDTMPSGTVVTVQSVSASQPVMCEYK